MSVIKGQNFRVSVGGKFVAASTSCSLHIASTLEDASTKDSTGNWQEQECTGKSWDGSADGLVVVDSAETGETAFSLTELVGTKVAIVFQETSGEKNREAKSGGVTYTGNAWVNDISISAGNKTNCQYSIQFTGDGSLVKS